MIGRTVSRYTIVSKLGGGGSANGCSRLGKPQRLFRSFFDEQKITYLDLLAEMRAHTAADDFYIRNDFHWNREGHDLAARRLAEYLSRKG